MHEKVDYTALNAASDKGEQPSYLAAADAHNYGNGNFAFTDSSTWGDGLDNAGKFIATAGLSGLNSFYNTGVTVGNWLGADLKENDTHAMIAALDDDLGKYYQNNQNAVDMAGFIATSIIPGLGGIKLLNMGQKVLRTAQETGMLGANLSRATGLLTPSAKAYTTLAAVDIAQSSATFSAVTGNALKAIGAGYGQAALESAAFEIAVTATSFKSPVLNDLDGWDIAKNMLVGTAVGGVIGGAINHAITLGNIKGAVKAFNPAEKQFADLADVTALSPAQRIISRNSHISDMPVAPTASEIADGSYTFAAPLLKDLNAGQQADVAGKLSGRLDRLRTETLTSMANKNRMDFQELSAGDKTLANHLTDMSVGLSGNQTIANMEGLVELGRIGKTLKAEKEIEKFTAKQAKNIDDILTGESGAGVLPKKVGYVKISGADMGKVTFDEPKILSLGDTHESAAEVLQTVSKYKFKESRIWDAKSADHTEAEARYIWADRNAKVTEGMQIGEHDIPLLERAMQAKLEKITVVSQAGNYEINTVQDLVKHLQVSKEEVAASLIQGHKAGTGVSTEAIAKITNVSQEFLEQGPSSALANDLFARQAAKAQYVKDLEAKGLFSHEKLDNFPYQPSYAKAAYDTSILKDMDAMQVSGMAYLKTQQKLYQQGIDNVLAKHLPDDLMNRLWHPGDEMMLKTNRFGSGPGLFSFANGGYHTPESWAETIGSATAAIQKHFKDATTDTLQSSLYKLASNQHAAIEFESINKTLMSTSEQYGINEAGNALVPLKILDWEAAVRAGKNVARPALQEGAPAQIAIKTPEALEAWNVRTGLTGARTEAFGEIRNAQGLTDLKDPRALRPIRPDPKDYPYYAIVVDESVTGVGHKSMIHAASPKELEEMIAKVPDNYKTYKGDQLKEYHKAHGEFDYEMTLHENYIDADLKKSGVNNPFFIKTDPQKIAQDMLRDHLKSDDIFTRELVNAKYEKEFSFLRQQGEQYTNTATSQYKGSYRDIENSVKNPYLNYVKTALNVSQISEHPYIMGLNQKLDSAVSKTWEVIGQAVRDTKSLEDLDKINKSLKEFGVKSAYYDAATDLLANHSAPKGVLVNFVSKANAMLSTLTLRLDPLNAINNAVGSTVLYGTELKSFINAMGSADGELAGKLTGMLKMDRPSMANLTGAPTDQVTTAGKIMQQAVKNWFDTEAKTLSGTPLKEYYSKNGWSTRLTDQARQMMEDLTLQGSETPSVMTSKLQSAFTAFKELANKGEKITGNKYAEEFNRFVSADSMRQLTDLGVQAGKITDQEAVGYINTFVNRTQGNIMATQRPLMFQGAVGQAVGLFQTYQFNMIQQLFRHVAEGAPKDAAMLLGLQGTMYGMNGLPGFNFLNTHIVGTMSGNVHHTDAYSSTYGMAGKSVGDLLLYGLPSNMLRANLYTRGDINPRQVTIVPVNPLDIPFVNATMKSYDNVANSLGKIANGASVWQTLLQGIEHNGISRPLAGLAQVAQAATHEGKVFSTTGKGSISGGNDLMSWATAARIAGGKPFDDAVANDATFRVTAYQAADRGKMDVLAQAIKTSGIGGGEISNDQINQFAARYAAAGGKQENFNKYMLKEIKSANTNKANLIMTNLKNPMSQKMQQIMGGTAGLDGYGVAGGMAGGAGSMEDY
jgi:hypothetical protein